ncbi:hypothetical protein CC80DRAFT_552742 [Byssothecium circinans]|uniref:Uncharacterized protein n=1 Tax=Byssothecium circinans TaxID=147558 RepID=A0A6A5TSS1_9PLEO|nr:hypothetical protein CC80DRAFT_552742 [Byssothecium circinans]
MAVLDCVRDCAQNHPISVAAGLIIALPGTYFLVTGQSMSCAVGLCDEATSPSSSPLASMVRGLSVYESHHPLDTRLNLAVSKWADKPASVFPIRIVQSTSNNIASFLTAVGDRLGLDAQRLLELFDERWDSHFSFSRLLSVAITTALPGSFLVFIRNRPQSWAARHQRGIANALHIFALVTVANQQISVQDLLVTAFVMVSFEALQRIVSHHGSDAVSEPAIETLLSQTHATVAKTDITPPTGLDENPLDNTSHIEDEDDGDLIMNSTTGSKDDEIARLRRMVTESRTAGKVKDIELKRTQGELKSARDTLNETFGEYSSLKDEMRTMKQTLGRDHQAIVYRKDIELFALRKANEQKENYINDRESKLEDISRTKKATLELKDAQIRNLQDRIKFLEAQESSRVSEGEDFKIDSAVDDDNDSHSNSAVKVKLLRVKGRNSLEIESIIEEKESEISKLKLDLSKAKSAATAPSKTQDELRRAWDATYAAQTALKEERVRHAQTQEKLREEVLRVEEQLKTSSPHNSFTALPTIEEQDKKELEAMFNAAQGDNLRLYAEVEALEKRVRESNARVFSAEQEAEALREQLHLEKTINEDMETARPSLVHRVHFQRMEGQLNESRNALQEKEQEILTLKKGVAEKEEKVEGAVKEKVEAIETRAKIEEENENLRKSVAELENTKIQLMKDHERLAKYRARQRTASAEARGASARSSGATLITEPVTVTEAMEPMPMSTPVSVVRANGHTPTSKGDYAHHDNEHDRELPARPVSLGTPTPSSSIQGTPERHRRGGGADTNANRLSMISNDIPPPELRAGRRKNLTLKGIMRKLAGRDESFEERHSTPSEEKRKTWGKGGKVVKEKGGKDGGEEKRMREKRTEEMENWMEKERPKTALLPKDMNKNVVLRPKTADTAGLMSGAGAKDFGTMVTPPQTIKLVQNETENGEKEEKEKEIQDERKGEQAQAQAQTQRQPQPQTQVQRPRTSSAPLPTKTPPPPPPPLPSDILPLPTKREERPLTAAPATVSAALKKENGKEQRPKMSSLGSRYYATSPEATGASVRPQTASGILAGARTQTATAPTTASDVKEKEKGEGKEKKKRWSLGGGNSRKLLRKSTVLQ